MDIRSRRWAAMPFALALALGLGACGGGGSASTESPAQEEQSSEASDSKDNGDLSFNGGDDEAEDQAEDTAETEEEEAAEDTEEDADKGSAAKSSSATMDWHWSLKKVGSFSGTKDSVRYSYDAPLNEYGAEKVSVIGIDGKSLTGSKGITNVSYLAGDYYAVTVEGDGDDVNRTGIYSLSEGEILAPEAAIIKVFADRTRDAHVAELIYGTEVTEDKDEAFFYSTDKQFSISASDEDTLWKGYAKVYDIDHKAFVGDIKIEDRDADITALADGHFVVGSYFSDDGYTLYDHKGKELWNGKESMSFGLDSIAYNLDGKGLIMGLDGNAKKTVEGSVMEVSGPSGYYGMRTDDGYIAIDSSGNQVLEGTYKTIYRECSGLFGVNDGKDDLVVNADGETLFEDTNHLTAVLDGVSVVADDDYNEYTLLYGDQVAVEGLTRDPSSNLIIVDDNDTYMNLSTCEYSVKLDSVGQLGTALVVGRTEGEACYGVFDLFTGEQLLDCVYDNVVPAAGYIYCFADGEWTVFKADLLQG